MTGDGCDTPWAVLLDGPTADTARQLVDTIAGRPRATPRAVRPDLAAGGAGLALAYHQLDLCRPGEGWHAMAAGHLEAAVRGAERMRGRAPGLLGGLGGLAFAAGRLGYPDLFGPERSGGPDTLGVDWRTVDRYTVDLRTVDRYTVDLRTVDLHTLDRRRALDLGSGLTGLGAVLLDHPEDPAAVARLETVLTVLGRQVAAFPGESPGMAHGPAGPLALLALALSAGVEVPGQVEAVHRAVDRLLVHRRDDDWGPDWALAEGADQASHQVSHHGADQALHQVSHQASRHGSGPSGSDRQPLPASWCHGGPGIARALWLAGTALDDATLRDLGRETLLAALRRPPELRRIDLRPGLCPGLAGLLLITLRFARDTADPAFRPAVRDVAARLIDLSGDRYGSGGSAAPGLLDGAAGVLLALLAASTPVPPGWDRALLLS
ncbi:MULTISPECIES: lanthionine synthetase LanC family protein [unclassified Kitasatospora]|uniref:lanthionine synthetase LanC family protein n=1 Tax=unclassified Kitasatospora TaxID=2633591 RepID=UPI0033D0222D